MNQRIVLSLILAGVVAIPQWGLAKSARALPQWLPRVSDAPRFLNSVQQRLQAKGGKEYIRQKMSEGRAQAAKRFSAVDRVSGKILPSLHVPETLLQLWIIAGIQGAMEIEKLKPLSGQTTTPMEVFGTMGDVLVNNFDIYAGLMGGAAVNMGFKPVLNNISATIASQVKNKVAARFFQTGVSTFVTFVGWEAGVQLWEESIYLLDEADITKAKELRLLDLLQGTGSSEEYAILQKVFENAFGIMTFVNPEQTSLWISNTFRLHLFTGPVLTMATSMAIFGAAAGSIAPGAGNIAGWALGFTGGIVGGLVYLVIPMPWQDGITDGIRESAIATSVSLLERDGIILKQYLRFLSGDANPMKDLHEKGFKSYVDLRAQSRSMAITYMMTQIQEAYVKLQSADQILQLAKEAPHLQAVREVDFINALESGQMQVRSEPLEKIVAENQHIKQQAEIKISHYFDRVLKLYRDESEFLATFVYADSPNFPPSARQHAQASIAKLENVYRAIRMIYTSVIPAKASEFSMPVYSAEEQQVLFTASQIYINLAYMRGFDERDLM